MGQLNFFEGEEEENPSDVQQAWDEQMNPSPTPPEMDKRFPDMTKEEADAARARGRAMSNSYHPTPTPEENVPIQTGTAAERRTRARAGAYDLTYGTGGSETDEKPSFWERFKAHDYTKALGEVYNLSQIPQQLGTAALVKLWEAGDEASGAKHLREGLKRWTLESEIKRRKKMQDDYAAEMDKAKEEAMSSLPAAIEAQRQGEKVSGPSRSVLMNKPVSPDEKYKAERDANEYYGDFRYNPPWMEIPRETYPDSKQHIGLDRPEDQIMQRMRARAEQEGWPGEPQPSF
jgi:hypothetical protein